MDPSALVFNGKPVSEDDFELILEIVNEYGLARTELAATVCELLDWRRPSGRLKEIDCLKFLEKLEAAGLLTLPARKNTLPGPIKKVQRGKRGEPGAPIECSLRDLGPVKLKHVTTKPQRDLYRELIDRYHYLGHKRPFGANLRYLVETESDAPVVVGCLQFTSPAWRLKERDLWIGWSDARRADHLQRVVQNSRFLVLPWVKVKGLASHVLAKAVKQLPEDWARIYGIRPLLLETFVDEGRFEGTCYKAANWLCLGQTTGRGRNDRKRENERVTKTVWVYPLHRKCRALLKGSEGAPVQ